MASVVVSCVGGEPQRVDAETVREAKELVDCSGYTATLNGDTCSDDDTLQDEDYLALSPQVKGGSR